MKQSLLMLALCASSVLFAENEALKKQALVWMPMEDSVANKGTAQCTVEVLGEKAPLFSPTPEGKGLVIDNTGISVTGLQVKGTDIYPGKCGTVFFRFRPLVDLSKEKGRNNLLHWGHHGELLDVYIAPEPDGSLYYQTKRQDSPTYWSPHIGFKYWKNPEIFPQWSDKQWYSIAVVWNESGPAVFYYNGRRLNSMKTCGYTHKPSSRFFLGCMGKDNRVANILLDDFCVFSRELTEEEIKTL